MLLRHLEYLRCPLQRIPFRCEVLETEERVLNGIPEKVVRSGLLFAGEDLVYPILEGVPRLTVEAFWVYASFLGKFCPDYAERKKRIDARYGSLIDQIRTKNASTQASFTREWEMFDPESDKTWNLDQSELLHRFETETGASVSAWKGKMVLDAGCGHGMLNLALAEAGVFNVGLDFSDSLTRAYIRNNSAHLLLVQGDVEFPPLAFHSFDLVHSSGVLIHTSRTELAFSCLDPLVRKGGRMSIWVYKKRKEFLHRFLNRLRNYTSAWPAGLQMLFFRGVLFPLAWTMKRLKGNPQKSSELMVEILDWFSPRFRWEHEPEECRSWFWKRGYQEVSIRDDNHWGFHMTGDKLV
jgi:SAM-dependent methyltransferase/uncharacterized protein YbaR (Trm112 family)